MSLLRQKGGEAQLEAGGMLRPCIPQHPATFRGRAPVVPLSLSPVVLLLCRRQAPSAGQLLDGAAAPGMGPVGAAGHSPPPSLPSPSCPSGLFL